MAIPTLAEFENAKTDLDDLEAILNGDSLTTVVTRLGAAVPTLSKAVADYGDPFRVNSFAEAVAFNHLNFSDGKNLFINYGVSLGDRLGGRFAWVPASTAADDGTDVFQLTSNGSNPGRLIRVSSETHKSASTGSIIRRLFDILAEHENIKDFGASSGGADAGPSFKLQAAAGGKIRVPSGIFHVDTISNFQSDGVIDLGGTGHGSTINVGVIAIPAPPDDVVDTNTGFFFGAVGSSSRVLTRVHELSFTSDSTPATAFKVSAVFPFFADHVRFYQMGGRAFHLNSCFYGRISNFELYESGMYLTGVNNFSIMGGDIHGTDAGAIFAATDYGNTLDNCDGVTIGECSIEAWKISRAFLIKNSKCINFRDIWWEGNTGDHVVKIEDSTDIALDGRYIDAFEAPTDAFFLIDNTNAGVYQTKGTTIDINGGMHIRLRTDTTLAGGNFLFVDIVNDGIAFLNISDVRLSEGYILLHQDCLANIRSTTLARSDWGTDSAKFLESVSNAKTSPDGYNSWCPNSAMNNPDMSGGAVVTDTTKKTITGITQANPAVVTSSSHGFTNGKAVYIQDVVGMTEVNGTWFTVANATANTFELQGVDSTGYTAYSSGGTAGLAAVTTDSTVTLENGISTKCVIKSANTSAVKVWRTQTDMGAITIDGDSMLVFVRIKSDQNVKLDITIEGDFGNVMQIPQLTTKKDVWIDYVLKPDADVSWAQGRFNPNKVAITITNDSGNDVNFWIDRIDYKIVNSDIFLP